MGAGPSSPSTRYTRRGHVDQDDKLPAVCRRHGVETIVESDAAAVSA